MARDVSKWRQEVLIKSKPVENKTSSKAENVSEWRKNVLNKNTPKAEPAKTEPVKVKPERVEPAKKETAKKDTVRQKQNAMEKRLSDNVSPAETKADDGKLTFSKLSEAVKRIPAALMNKDTQQEIRKPVWDAINKASDFNDVQGAEMRKYAFGDNRPFEEGNAPTTGNKTVDSIAKVAGMVSSAFVPSGGGAPSMAAPVRNAAEYAANKIIPNAGNVVGRVGNVALRGSLESLPYTAQQLFIGDKKNIKDMAKIAGKDLIFGVVTELGIEGAGELFKVIGNKIKKGVSLSAKEEAIVDEASNSAETIADVAPAKQIETELPKVEVKRPGTIPGEIGKQTPAKNIDDYILDQKNKVDDLRYQRNELGVDTTKDIETAESELLRLQKKKYLPYYKKELSSLEKIQREMFDESGLTPEFSAMSDRVTKLKGKIADIERKVETPKTETVVEPMRNDVAQSKPETMAQRVTAKVDTGQVSTPSTNKVAQNGVHEVVDKLEGNQAQLFNVYTSNLKRIAEESGLDMTGFYNDTKNVNAFNPSAKDVDTIISGYKKLFSNTANPKATEYIDSINKIKAKIQNGVQQPTLNSEGVLDNSQKQVYNANGGDINGRAKQESRYQDTGESIGIRSNSDQSLESGRVYRRSDSGRTVLLRIDDSDVTNSTRLVPDENIAKTLSEKNKDLTDIYGVSDPNAFHNAISKAKKEIPQGPYVTSHTPEEYSKMKTYLTDGGHAGIAVTEDGDIVSVFNNRGKSNIRGGATQLLLTALENGGRKLDNFNGQLSKIYEQHGFIPVSKTKFNKEFAPPDWKPEFKEPDIVFWVHNGDSSTEVASKTGKYDPYDMSAVTEFDSYDEAAAYRDKYISDAEANKSNGSASSKVPSTDAEKLLVEEYTAKLPEMEDELKAIVTNLTEQAKNERDEGKLLKINLQLFAANEKLRAISKFRTNTLMKTVNLADGEIQKIIDELDMTYGVKTHKETLRKAENMVNSDMQGTMNRIKEKGLESAEDTAASFLIEKALKEDAVKTGDYTKLKSWLKTVQVSGTKHGQTIEAFKLWQEDPDGMLKNATKTVEDAEGAMKKSNPEKIKQIDNETKKVIDEVDKVDKDTADGIADEVNKKADEIINRKGKPGIDGKTDGKTGGKSDGKAPAAKEEPLPEEMLANKIKNYIKEAEPKKDDPVMNMVNELFRVAKESPIDKAKVKSKSAIEFVAEAISDRKNYVDTWIKAKSIVRERLKDNPEALAKLEQYFDKGIRPPFSSESFNKSIKEGMKSLDQNLGQIVRDYYAQGSKSRKDLTEYLIEKSGLKGEDAEALAKYVKNRMKELTKEQKEKILKGIFPRQSATTKAKPGALKSVEELSNVGAFVNNNYKDKVMEKLSPRLQKVINEKFKGVPTKASGAVIDDGRIDFGELVRKSTTDIEFTRVKFLKEISEKLQVNDTDAKTILTAVEKRFNEIVDEKRASILGNMFKKREATIKKTGIQRVQEYINKQVELENLGANSDAIRDFIKEKYGLPTLTNDDMAFITNHIEELKKLKVDSRPYNETLWRIYNRIESKVPSTFVDKFRAWQRISMLPNAKTFGRNILGNVFMEKIENFNELTTEALVDTVTSAFTGKREILGPTAAIQKSIAQTKGKLKGLSDTLTDIKHGVNTYDVQGQYEINVSKNAFKNPALNALEQFTNKSLQFGDRPFYEAAKARRLKELTILRKAKDITDDMEADAVLYALDRTFQNDSKLAKGVLKIKKAIDDPVYEAIANIIVPFAKTPANILDKISDYTPIGLIKAVGHLGKTAGKGTFDQKYFSQRLGRMLTGSGVITLGYVLAKNNVITGKSEKTTTKKGAFDRETGKLGYAFKTEDGYVAYDWAQPIGSLLTLGADAYGQGMNEGDVLKGIEGAGNTFFNMSMLQSLNSLFSYGNPMGGFINTMLGAPLQFTPTGQKQLAKITDKFERDTTAESYWEEAANKFKANIPGLRQTLPTKTDTFGNPIEIQEGYGPLQKAINIAANPAIVTKSNMKDYEKEMDRLYNIDTGLKTKSDVLPSILQKTISDGKGTEYQLTSEQYNKYKKLYGDIAVNGLKNAKGHILRLGLETTIRSAEYKKLSDKERAKKISGILSKAMDKAKDEMLDELKED